MFSRKQSWLGRPLHLALAVALATVLGTNSPCDSAEPPHHPVYLSLFHPWSTSRSPDTSTNAALSVLYGRTGITHGLGLHGIASRVGESASGVHLTGAYSQIDGDARGLFATGGVTFVAGQARGIQVSGLVNYNRGMFSGFQYATIFNFVEAGFVGVQWSPTFNLNNGDGKYLQLSAAANMTAGGFRGVQLAFLNTVNDELTGVQLGGANLATEVRGTQAGLFNAASTVNGTQIGIVNISNQMDGIPIGVVNSAKNGRLGWSAVGSSYAAISVALRTQVRGIQSELSVGVGDLKESLGDTGFLAWHYGYNFDLANKWRLTPDAGFVHVIPASTNRDTPKEQVHYSIQARLVAEVDISDRLTGFFGGGANIVYSEYSSSATSETDPLIVLGATLY